MASTADTFGLCFYEGLQTPEGRIVVRYRGPDFEPKHFNTEHLDWGLLNADSYRLAALLMDDVGCFHWPWPRMREEFNEMVLSKMPREKKWRLWSSEIRFFREKIYRESVEGRTWPECMINHGKGWA
jgi:hypothetical protein